MSTIAKPTTRDSKSPEAKPPFPRKLLEIREVKTPQERREYDKIVFSKWKREDVELRDGHFQDHRRFIACLSDRVVGTGMLAKIPKSGKYAILRVAVEELYSDPLLAISEKISRRIEEEARRMGLMELISYCSERLMKIYQRFAGYEPVELRHDDPAGPYWVIRKKLSNMILVGEEVAHEKMFLRDELSGKGWKLELTRVSSRIAVLLLTTDENPGGETLLVSKEREAEFEVGGGEMIVRAPSVSDAELSAEISVVKKIRRN